MLRLAARTLVCLALAVPAMLAGVRCSPAPPVAPTVGQPPPDAALDAAGDTTPATSDVSSGRGPGDARSASETPPPADATPAPEAARSSPAACETPGAAVLPRCAANPQAQGCPLDIPATAVVSVAVLELAGYDDLGDHAFDEHVPLLVMCYGEALAAAPEAPVVVEATLDVAPNGCATVRRISGDWPTRRMHDCVKGVLQWLALPATESPDGASCKLRLEFVS